MPRETEYESHEDVDADVELGELEPEDADLNDNGNNDFPDFGDDETPFGTGD